MEARFCWWGGGLPTVRNCGGDSGAFCYRVCGAGGGEGAVWSNAGGGVGGDTALQREDTREGGENHRVVGGDVEKEKKRNGLTNAGTCTSVVWAHRGANRKNIIIIIIMHWILFVSCDMYVLMIPKQNTFSSLINGNHKGYYLFTEHLKMDAIN